MKWILGGLGAVVAILLIIVSGMYIAGGGTYEYTQSTTINMPAKQVFENITDPTLQKGWMSGVKEITPLTEGETRVGSKSKIVIDQNGTTMELTDEVIELKKNRLLVVQLSGQPFTMTNRFELTPVQKQTTLKQTLQCKFNGSARFAAPFMGEAIKAKMNEDLTRLRTVLEQKRETERLMKSRNR